MNICKSWIYQVVKGGLFDPDDVAKLAPPALPRVDIRDIVPALHTQTSTTRVSWAVPLFRESFSAAEIRCASTTVSSPT